MMLLLSLFMLLLSLLLTLQLLSLFMLLLTLLLVLLLLRYFAYVFAFEPLT
jgi:hypothetical protein